MYDDILEELKERYRADLRHIEEAERRADKETLYFRIGASATGNAD